MEQAQPLLAEAQTKFEGSKSKIDRRYLVPSIAKSKAARRTDSELKAIYDRYLSAGLFEAFLVSAVSQFESFLADVLMEYFAHYPKRITESVQGIPACAGVSAKDLMAAKSKEDLVQRVLSDHINNVFRERPSIYMAYVARILGVSIDPSFTDYFEVAASRDLVVHNNNVINAIYLQKADKKARGTLGETLKIDRDYYVSAIANLKKTAGAIKHDIEKKYGSGDNGKK